MAFEFLKRANDNETAEQIQLRERKEYIADASEVLDAMKEWSKKHSASIKMQHDEAVAAAYMGIMDAYAEANEAVIALEGSPKNDDLFALAEEKMNTLRVTVVEMQQVIPSLPDIGM